MSMKRLFIFESTTDDVEIDLSDLEDEKPEPTSSSNVSIDRDDRDDNGEPQTLWDAAEDRFPSGKMPAVHVKRLLKRHGYTWEDFAADEGLPSTMPSSVDWKKLLGWMGY